MNAAAKNSASTTAITRTFLDIPRASGSSSRMIIS
jgi:hypothetical protein